MLPLAGERTRILLYSLVIPYLNAESGENISTEDTAMMALVFRAFNMDEESSKALSAVYRCQWENGGVPESDNEQLNDRTSATAWYAMAAEGYNLFQTKE